MVEPPGFLTVASETGLSLRTFELGASAAPFVVSLAGVSARAAGFCAVPLPGMLLLCSRGAGSLARVFMRGRRGRGRRLSLGGQGEGGNRRNGQKQSKCLVHRVSHQRRGGSVRRQDGPPAGGKSGAVGPRVDPPAPRPAAFFQAAMNQMPLSVLLDANPFWRLE